MECRRHAPSNGRESLYPASGQYRARRATAKCLPPRVCRVTPRPPLKSTFHLSYSFSSHIASSLTCSRWPFTILRVAQSFLYLRVFFWAGGREGFASYVAVLLHFRALRLAAPLPTRSRLPPPAESSFSPSGARQLQFSPPGPHFPNRHTQFFLRSVHAFPSHPDWLGLGTTNGALHSGAPCHKAVASLRSHGHNARLHCLRFRRTSRTRRSLSTHAIFRTDMTGL